MKLTKMALSVFIGEDGYPRGFIFPNNHKVIYTCTEADEDAIHDLWEQKDVPIKNITSTAKSKIYGD